MVRPNDYLGQSIHKTHTNILFLLFKNAFQWNFFHYRHTNFVNFLNKTTTKQKRYKIFENFV